MNKKNKDKILGLEDDELEMVTGGRGQFTIEIDGKKYLRSCELAPNDQIFTDIYYRHPKNFCSNFEWNKVGQIQQLCKCCLHFSNTLV